ncbi:unnamed protein product [Ilex paraguariensis]|uniref:Anther-specific protein LAT52-like n=1 Tax=Ilex paraguariensis TaxID=185542 RepID=A0ABC8QN67_9AQUA
MAKAIALIASALCILALAGFAQCHQTEQLFNVEGKVYCDTCRVQFHTKISQNIPEAKVRLECRHRQLGKITYSVEGVTDATGHYSLPVAGDRQEDICEVMVLESPQADCNEPMKGLDRARVLCTENGGMTSKVRYANPLGFMKKEALCGCKEVLDALGFLPIQY